MSEATEEEFAIMEERAREEALALSVDRLRQPISSLIWHRSEVLSKSASINAALEAIVRSGHGAVAILDQGDLIGLITERTALRNEIGDPGLPRDLPVELLMERNPEVLRCDDEILYLLNRLYVNEETHVAIVDEEGHFQFLVSLQDVLAALCEPFDQVISTVPPEPYHGEPHLWGG